MDGFLFRKFVLVVYLVAGIPLNVIVIWVVKRKHSMQSPTNILLCNIAAVDIIALLYQCVMFIENIPQGILGSIICKLLRDDLFWAVSALTLAVIAVERYLALLKPMITNVRLTKENVGYAIAALWVICSVVILLPHMVIRKAGFDEKLQRWLCNGGDSHAFYIYNWVINCFFAITVSVVSFCYLSIAKGIFCENSICSETVQTKEEQQEKRKIVRFLMVITCAFYIAYISYLVRIVTFRLLKVDLHSYDNILAFLMSSHAICNPLVYILFNSNYKAGTKELFSSVKNVSCPC